MKRQRRSAPAPLETRYARLKTKLTRLGPILLGTISARTISRPDPLKPGAVKTYGPYYQWTFKREGKTVTRNLTAKQAKLYQQAIANHRTLNMILNEMKNISLTILESTSVGVNKRKPRK